MNIDFKPVFEKQTHLLYHLLRVVIVDNNPAAMVATTDNGLLFPNQRHVLAG